MNGTDESVESKERIDTIGFRNRSVLFQNSQRGIFHGMVKAFEPSVRLMEQLQREDISKDQSLEKICSHPFEEFLKELKSHVDDRLNADDEDTSHESTPPKTNQDSSTTKSNLNLVIQFHSIAFHKHYHFNEEERLAHSLCEDVDKFYVLKESGKKEYFISRFVALTKSITDVPDHCQHSDMRNTFEDIQSILNEIADTEHTIQSAFMTVIQKWKDLKTLRTNQGFQSTTVMLEKDSVEEKDINSLDGMKESLSLLESKTSWLLQHLSLSSNDNDHRDYREELKALLWTGNVIVSTMSSRTEIRIIKNDTKYLSSIAMHQTEQKRRSSLQAEKYLIRFVLNGNVVFQTKANEIVWPSWTLYLNETATCRLSKYPNNISVQIFRCRFGLLPDEFISETVIECPGRDISTDANQLTMLGETEASTTFSSNSNSRNVGGTVHYTISWTIAEECPASALDIPQVGVPPLRAQQILGQTHHQFSPIRRNQTAYCSSKDDLTFSFLTRYTTAFRMHDTNHLYMNCSRVQEPLRHCMLRQRSRGQSEWDGAIPLLDSEIRTEYRNRLIGSKEESLNDEESMTRKAFAERTAVPEKHVQTLVKQALQARNSKFHSATSLDFDDLVYDESYIRSHRPPQDIGLLLESFFLKTREGLERSSYQADISRNDRRSCVLVSALNADNIPCREMVRSDEVNGLLSSPPRIRRITATTSNTNVFMNDALSDVSVTHVENHLIQFSLDGKKFETRIGKDHVEIPLNLNDRNEILTPAMLRRSTKRIYISLFDLVDIRIESDELFFRKDIIISKEKRFLGFVEIPLLALYSQNNIRYNGTVMLNNPPIIFGYKSKAYQSLQSRVVDIEEGAASTRKMMQSTSLQISIMIQPEVHYLTHPIQSISSSAEIKKLIEYSHKWIEQFHQINQFSASRNVTLFGYHLEKKSHLITQYLKPQNPPPEFTSLHQVAHFVSLIPRLRTWKSFESDIENLSWITNQQVLDSSAADWEARAILLANYFLSLIEVNQSVFLVFGTSLSEGKVVYVMISNYFGHMTFWNPLTGSNFSEEDDDICSLINVDCLVSTNNIYGNVQAAGRPSILDFNISDRMAWMPFFHPRRNPYIQLNSIQESYLNYSDPNIQFALKIELDIKERIKSEIRSWRNKPSKFNTDLSDRLGMILIDLEDRKCNGLQFESSANYLRTISDVCIEKQVFGFPLHFSFTSIDEIIDHIHLTAVHEAKHPQVEFALAVKVFPYVSSLNSVWVFLCTVV